MGVKQGWILAHLLFNVSFLAVTILANDTQDLAGIRLRIKFDDWAFHLQWIKAHRKVSYVTVRDLQYVDDAVVVAGISKDLHAEVTRINSQFSSLGIIMNKSKTLYYIYQPKLTDVEIIKFGV